jgi:hypothetical protein
MDVESFAAQEVSVDWRGRPCAPGRHGGMRAAVFVLGTYYVASYGGAREQCPWLVS